jgi:uncharacterized membrane protein
MRGNKSGAVAIFIGVLLIVVFAVGLICEKNPSAFVRKYQYDFALDQFGAFCASIWLPAGIIGIPLLVISLVVSLVRERKEKEKE